MNREEWLSKVGEAMSPWYDARGYPLPAWRVSCGFPSTSALARKSRRIGECWSGRVSADGAAEIFISPLVADSTRVAEILCHELAHAAVGTEHGHGGPFVKLIRKLGLEGKPTATEPGPEFLVRIRPILAKVGEYPHAPMAPSTDDRKKQTTRLVKVECPSCLNEGEPYIVRMSRQATEKGYPICPEHMKPMGERDDEGNF